MPATYRGYVYKAGRYRHPVRMESADDITSFLKEHLYEEEVRIVDADDFLVFRAVDGVDLYSRLDGLGINVRDLYLEIRRGWVAEEKEKETEEAEEYQQYEPWEELYDSIGLSSGEVQMRQAAKRACRAARTVADVVELLEGTYFDAFFETEDGTRAWGYFEPGDCSVTVLKKQGDGGWQGDWGNRVRLEPGARVRHRASGEDVHAFILLDPPGSGI